MNRHLQPYGLHFGYRVFDEIALFIRYAKSLPQVVGRTLTEEEALDYAVLMKVLPKFHGPRQKLETPLWYVVRWCLNGSGEGGEQFSPQFIWKRITGEDKTPTHHDIANLLIRWEENKENFRFPATARKALQMLRQLYEVGFASFAQ